MQELPLRNRPEIEEKDYGEYSLLLSQNSSATLEGFISGLDWGELGGYEALSTVLDWTVNPLVGEGLVLLDGAERDWLGTVG